MERLLLGLLRRLGAALVIIYVAAVVVVGLGLGLYAETWLGRAAFLAATLLGLLPWAVGHWATGHSLLSRKARPALACLVLIGLSLGFVVSNAPDGRSRPGSRVSNRFVGEDWPFPRYSPANLVPEIEQIKLGVAVTVPTVPFVDLAQAQHILDVTMPIYRQMEQDPDFRSLGSVMGWAYAELWGGRFDYGHYYLYLPETAPGDKLPAIIFLHGSGGNFKTYLWLWSQWAEERGWAVICPSFGFGNWDRPAGVEAIQTAVDHALDTLPLDPTRLYLVGLSNGGRGVSRAAVLAPEQYRGLVFLSSIIEEEVVLGDDFVQGWRDRPVLVLHADQDRRIPARYVRDRVAGLKRAGVNVSYREYAREDHFLFFSQPDAVLDRIGAWLEEID